LTQVRNKRFLSRFLTVIVIIATFGIGMFAYPLVYKPGQAALETYVPVEWNGNTRNFLITMEHGEWEVASGVTQEVWTFNRTLPGPVVRVTAGDRVHITLVNDAPIGHSIDFHASLMAWDKGMKTIEGGETMEIEFVAKYVGVFMYHCGTAPVLMHIGMGMYGAIIVDPVEPRTPAKEFVLVQSELYEDYSDMKARLPRYIVFNGRAFQYRDSPLDVKKNEPIRLYVMNAGPQFVSNFHVVGTVFDAVYPNGNPLNRLFGLETNVVPAGGSAVFEFRLTEVGLNPFVTHSFADATQGAVGLFNVTE